MIDLFLLCSLKKKKNRKKEKKNFVDMTRSFRSLPLKEAHNIVASFFLSNLQSLVQTMTIRNTLLWPIKFISTVINCVPLLVQRVNPSGDGITFSFIYSNRKVHWESCDA